MQGFKTNYVNLIADNLRDRYDNGFPILKELIQNADDAKAHQLIFGMHPGFPDSHHLLLRGSGLWFFNDGEFKENDAEDLRSFGIGSKAGDTSAIGKFGLGMKSVFHLCEALFYVAWDGNHFHCEGLTPWKQDSHTLHKEWDETSDTDWCRLKDLGNDLAADGGKDCTWFLLWLPLRMKKHLQTHAGQETGAIINRFPGDEPAGELAFLNDEKLAHDMAEMLPLLRHLERVEHKGEDNRFVLRLADVPRLMGEPLRQQVGGQVLWADGRQRLAFSGRRIEGPDTDGRFADMKAREEWPRTRSRNEWGHECQKKDKASAEGAVLFCSGRRSETSSRLHWAVFLPVEDGSEDLGSNHGERGHSLILHGQFFLDAGRKKIHDREHLHREPELLGEMPIDESLLRRIWNQRLAQDVVLPLVLPTLEDHVGRPDLSDDECRELTGAMSESAWFRTFRGYICRDRVWLRTLEQDAKPRWRLVEGDSRSLLRPLPNPPRSAPERPWKVFPGLITCDVVPYDVEAPCLDRSNKPGEWTERELESLLSRLDGLFVDAPSMDYVIAFLEICAEPHLSTERVQRGFLVALRHGLRAAGREARRRVKAKATRLVGFLQPERRLALAAELPEPILKDLWALDAPVLLIPKGMEPESPGKASPDQPALAAWLRVLDRALDSPDNEGAHQPILQAVHGLLQTLSAKDRGRFLREHRTLRIIRVREARSEVEKPVSVEYLDQVRRAGCLFTFPGGVGDAGMGIAPQLARAMPDADVCLVRAQTWHELFFEDEAQGGVSRIPAASDGQACLAAVGRYTSHLGDLADRRGLLARANDPGTDADAQRGLRFLLHGFLDHRDDDGEKLWIGRHGQHGAWNLLWTEMHETARWSSVDEELANAIPRNCWSFANIAEIDARTLIDELRNTGQDIDAPEKFSVDQRDEILSCIEDKDLWQHLPLHTTLEKTPVSAARERVYLAPRTEGHEDPLTRETTLIAPSQHPTVSRQQRDWLRPLNDQARIEIALGAEKPVRYWHDVMDALDRLPTTLDEDLRTRLRSRAWLPTTHPAPVKPEDVIDLQGSLSDATHLLVAEHREAHDPCFAVPADLDAAVRDHKAWPRLREVGFSSGVAGIERLGLLLEDLPNYHIGKWTEQPLSDATGLLARCDELPGWRLLEMASAEPFSLEVAWNQLGPALSSAIEPQRLAAVLDWLSGDKDQWELRKSAHDDYLRQLTARGQIAREHLPRLRFASADCRWQEAVELCVGAPGVVNGSLLDTKQETILGNLVCRAEPGTRGEQPGEGAVDFPMAQDAAREILRGYFRAWDSSLVPQPMIGVMLALLGPKLRELANEYLHPHSFEWLVRKLPWPDPGRTRERIEWMGGRTVVEALELIQAGVRVKSGDEVEVRNLLGHPIWVALDANPSTLLVGHPDWQEGYGVMITLRNVDPDRFRTTQLSDLLRATAEQLYSGLYNQRNVNFDSLWQELAKSDQLEIEIARRLILDHIPFYLKQLSVKCERIRKQLKTCDSLRRRIAEAEEDGQSADSARTGLRRALDELADCIDRRPDEQQAVVQAVKSKLEQYQYEISSIPLELFQNADDAAVELGQCHTYPLEGSEVPESARRFVVEEREDGLGFLHWGRPINARGPVGFDGEGRGYDRDLEKMLILSATDKPGDEGVTGKFGLGFKSVLLACEQPRILSGRLAIRVVAGILPQPWEDVREARRRLTAFSTDSGQPGTLIDLPGVERELRARVLERFRQLAGILCVFGRAIRSITHVAMSKSSWSWEPNEIFPAVEVGELHLQDDWDARTRALCVRARDGSLLMALGPQGFRPLPDSVPALWVTAPTREPSSVGFAVNGSFDLDAGRGRLAGDTDKNLEKARRIGQQTGDALGALLERSHEDWSSVQAALGLAALDALGFWESVWSGLTKGCSRGDGEDLAREAALGVLIQLCKHPHAIPNGLKGSLRHFSDASEIRCELSGVLLREDVGEELGAWERFTNRYPARKCVSKEIGSILREAALCSPQFLGLSPLVGLLERSKVEPADAEVLGRLRLLTEEEKDWESDDLRERLNGLLFRSEADEWTEARKLLAIQGPLDPDEPRRHKLAPPECRLHADYYTERGDEWPAITFFLACRQRMEAPADTLAQWVLDAESVEARSAALGYLADGELGERLAERVRERGWLRTAFNDPGLTSGLTEGQQHKLRRRLVSASQLEQAVAADTDSPERQLPDNSHLDLPTALELLHQWWSENRRQRAEAYRDRLYPQELAITPEPDADGRNLSDSSWFMLLALGSFQGMGRTREEQHRDFIRRCQEHGWWDIFAERDPKEAPDLWMNIIEEYAEAQHDDEEWAQWLGQFPKLYRLRRWLNDYVDLFLSINRYEEKFTLDGILAPRSNPNLQGGGIDAPPLTRTLKIGSHLVIRELLHHGVIENTIAIPHAYAPIERIRDFFQKFGTDVSTSEDIYQILKDHLGEDRATFSGDYDIPLRIISSDDSLRRRLLLESKLEERFIEALRRIQIEGRSIKVEKDLGGDTPRFRLTTKELTYIMTPQPEFGANEGTTIPCRADFEIRSASKSDEQPPIVVFTDGFKYHRDSTGDDAAKRMALVRAGYLVWSLTWHDLKAVFGDGDEAANLLGEDDGHMTERQRELDADWNTSQIRSYLAKPSLALLALYLQNPEVTQWNRAVFTELLRLFQSANMQCEELRARCSDFAQQLPKEFQDSLFALSGEALFAARGRWWSTPPNFVDLLLALPLDALEHADPTQLRVAVHLNDVETRPDGYRQEWNGVLRLYNLLQFLPGASWTTAKGVGRHPWLPEQD